MRRRSGSMSAMRIETSPKSSLTPFELARYLDYCTEMFSLIGKIAALYVQRFDDSVALSSVRVAAVAFFLAPAIASVFTPTFLFGIEGFLVSHDFAFWCFRNPRAKTYITPL